MAYIEKRAVTSQMETCEQPEACDGVLIHVSPHPAGRNSVSTCVFSVCVTLQRTHQTGGLRLTAPHEEAVLWASMRET